MALKMGRATSKLVAAVGKSGLAKGVKAGSIIRAAARALGGGWPEAQKLEEALAAGREAVRAGA